MSALGSYVKESATLRIGKYEYLEEKQRYVEMFWIFADLVYLYKRGEETWDTVDSWWQRMMLVLPDEITLIDTDKPNLPMSLDEVVEAHLTQDLSNEKRIAVATNRDQIQLSKDLDQMEVNARYDVAAAYVVKLRRILTEAKIMNQFLTEKIESTSKPSV